MPLLRRLAEYAVLDADLARTEADDLEEAGKKASAAPQRGRIRRAWHRLSTRMEFRVKLIVFGASRGVGRSLTELALADGHRVTAVVRNPSTVGLNHESLEVVAGDVTDADSVRRCLPGHEVAFCAVGADKRGATTLYSTAARNIASAMDDQGVRRLVFLSNFGVLGEKGSGARTAAVVFIAKLLLRPTLEDHRRALDELRKHNWEWIAVRPMRLTNGPRTGHYRVAVDGLPRGGARISRADVADLMLKQVTSSEYVHRIPAIAY